MAPSTHSISSAFFLIYYEVKFMTSAYKTEREHGIIIYADNYVKSGIWVYDCDFARLISRTPYPPPTEDPATAKEFNVGRGILHLRPEHRGPAAEAIAHLTAQPSWHLNLRYVFSGLDHRGDLSTHVFQTVIEHDGGKWGLHITQFYPALDGSSRSYWVRIRPYDPDNHLDYDKAFKAALESCPVPQ